MSNRITDKDLQNLAARINAELETPQNPYEENGKTNIGNMHIAHAYGGVCLHQMVNNDGGVRTVLCGGYVPKRALFEQLHAYLAGIETRKGDLA